MSDKFEKLGKGVQIAEEFRDKTVLEGFMADLFRGKASFDSLIFWPPVCLNELEQHERLFWEVKNFLLDKTDAQLMEKMEGIPWALFKEMSELGLFGLKAPKEWDGKELSQTAYTELVGLIASYSGPIAILISADNTIGCKFPILKFGTPEQKAKYLPELTKWPSGFCFTEKDVGSDPASMKTYARRVKNEKGETVGYDLNGQKWYTTNAPLENNEPLAKYLMVIAKIVDKPEEVQESKIFGSFIVETSAPGVEVGPRNEFCGMKGIYNSNPTFKKVFVARDQLIGQEGDGFRIALQALNTGRIAIGGSCVATAKQSFSMMSWWVKKRKQWGGPIGEKEAIGSGMLVPAAANILAMEAMVKYAAHLIDSGQDARLEAAAGKVFASEKMWQVVDDMMQIFGGRGYETQESLARRETALPVERIFRDARPNRIFEGSTQILSQWLVREGLDDYLKEGEAFLDKGQLLRKLKTALKFSKKYLKTYFPRHNVHSFPKTLQSHARFVELSAGRLAREIIKLSSFYRGKLMFKQLTIARLFWIVTYLTAMATTCSYAGTAVYWRDDESYLLLADTFCRMARREVKKLFNELWDNDDDLHCQVAKKVLAGDFKNILESGIIPLTAELEE